MVGTSTQAKDHPSQQAAEIPDLGTESSLRSNSIDLDAERRRAASNYDFASTAIESTSPVISDPGTPPEVIARIDSQNADYARGVERTRQYMEAYEKLHPRNDRLGAIFEVVTRDLGDYLKSDPYLAMKVSGFIAMNLALDATGFGAVATAIDVTLLSQAMVDTGLGMVTAIKELSNARTEQEKTQAIASLVENFSGMVLALGGTSAVAKTRGAAFAADLDVALSTGTKALQRAGETSGQGVRGSSTPHAPIESPGKVDAGVQSRVRESSQTGSQFATRGQAEEAVVGRSDRIGRASEDSPQPVARGKRREDSSESLASRSKLDLVEQADAPVATTSLPGKVTVLCEKLPETAVVLDPTNIRYSQENISQGRYNKIKASMEENGFVVKDPERDILNVVRMQDGELTSVDNTRILVANETGNPVVAKVHEYNEPMSPADARRFPNREGGPLPRTWGEAMTNRIRANVVRKADGTIKRHGNELEWIKENPFGSTTSPKFDAPYDLVLTGGE